MVGRNKRGAFIAALGVFALSGGTTAEAFTLEPPTVRSHGVTERHACFRGGVEQDGNVVTVIDPAPCKLQRPRPNPLPVHREGRVHIRTAEQAERVTVTVRSRAGERVLQAHAVDGDHRRWRIRMPRFRDRSKLGITIVYPDGDASWSLPVKRHRH
jgi:hypothetical protein